MNATTLWQACAADVTVVQERAMNRVLLMRKILVALMLAVLPMAGLMAVASAATTPAEQQQQQLLKKKQQAAAEAKHFWRP